MVNKKKKGGAEKKKKLQERRAKQDASQALNQYASEFRSLLLTARQEYAKGRAYDAVDLQNEAIKLGSEKLPRFNDNSLVKAHALIELALAKSAVQTDFASGDEWKKVHGECKAAFLEALDIFQNRLVSGTVTTYRREECWFDATGQYVSPVPHTERLGPVDYTACINFVVSLDPSEETIKAIQRAINFFHDFEARSRELRLEAGGSLQGEVPPGCMDRMMSYLKEHKGVVTGTTDTESAFGRIHPEVHEEVRHTGSLEGKMKHTHRKLAKDVDKHGLKSCENPACDNSEMQPRQFATCSRCSWAAYCCRDCQKDDWKRHKKECKSGDAAKNLEKHEMQNKSDNALMVGQSQHVLTIVRYLHHFAATSLELMDTKTSEAMRCIMYVKGQFEGQSLGTIQLGQQEVSLTWDAIWSMTSQRRTKMISKFLKEMGKFNFPKGGPDFNIVTEWGSHAVHGDFYIVKHTSKGSILLHQDAEGKIRAFLVVGITQSIEKIVKAIPDPLPLPVKTALLPFKGLVLCQGTFVPPNGGMSKELNKVATAFVNGDDSGIKVETSLV